LPITQKVATTGFGLPTDRTFPESMLTSVKSIRIWFIETKQLFNAHFPGNPSLLFLNSQR